MFLRMYEEIMSSVKNSKDKEMLRKAFSEFANSGRIVHFDDPLLKVALIALRLDYLNLPDYMEYLNHKCGQDRTETVIVIEQLGKENHWSDEYIIEKIEDLCNYTHNEAGYAHYEHLYYEKAAERLAESTANGTPLVITDVWKDPEYKEIMENMQKYSECIQV